MSVFERTLITSRIVSCSEITITVLGVRESVMKKKEKASEVFCTAGVIIFLSVNYIMNMLTEKCLKQFWGGKTSSMKLNVLSQRCQKRNKLT